MTQGLLPLDLNDTEKEVELSYVFLKKFPDTGVRNLSLITKDSSSRAYYFMAHEIYLTPDLTLSFTARLSKGANRKWAG
jgi:hypothetical protein